MSDSDADSADVAKNVASEDANASDEDAPPGNADAQETEPCFTGNGEASPFGLAPELHRLSPQKGRSPVKKG